MCCAILLPHVAHAMAQRPGHDLCRLLPPAIGLWQLRHIFALPCPWPKRLRLADGCSRQMLAPRFSRCRWTAASRRCCCCCSRRRSQCSCRGCAGPLPSAPCNELVAPATAASATAALCLCTNACSCAVLVRRTTSSGLIGAPPADSCAKSIVSCCACTLYSAAAVSHSLVLLGLSCKTTFLARCSSAAVSMGAGASMALSGRRGWLDRPRRLCAACCEKSILFPAADEVGCRCRLTLTLLLLLLPLPLLKMVG